ncbi:MAG: type II pantothenate kinase [Clostridia bacterium]|nr:type II pantothenate kinase [Clostridia bacterium]MBQ4574988.1 type II pantothenate kinase [Clostridia bacterium]
MKTTIGIDVGGSTTKIVGFTSDGKLIEPMYVRAADPMTSVYGAFGKFTAEGGIELGDIGRVMVTGVGSSFLTKPIYGLECHNTPEFLSVGLGGMYLSGLDDAIVVSMGTGTALIHAEKGEKITYLGGTGVGGGTLMGLSKKLLGMDNISHIVELAAEGDLDKIDLRIKDITRKDILPGMPENMTAANFGKLSDIATKADLALGVINMIFETVGMMAIFAARTYKLRDIVLTGNLTSVPQAKEIFKTLNSMFDMNFIIPERSQFSTVIGAALSYNTTVQYKG